MVDACTRFVAEHVHTYIFLVLARMGILRCRELFCSNSSYSFVTLPQGVAPRMVLYVVDLYPPLPEFDSLFSTFISAMREREKKCMVHLTALKCTGVLAFARIIRITIILSACVVCHSLRYLYLSIQD